MSDKPMFADAKVGDRLWNPRVGYAKVTRLKHNPYPEHRCMELEVEIGGAIVNVKYDGKLDENDLNPIWFWDEVKIAVPERPREVEEPVKCERCKEEIPGNGVCYNPIFSLDGILCVKCHTRENDIFKKHYVLSSTPCEACDHIEAIKGRRVTGHTNIFHNLTPEQLALKWVINGRHYRNHTCGK
jgi:hypothetical protein